MALFDFLKKVQKVVNVVSTVLDEADLSNRQDPSSRRSRYECADDDIPEGAPAKNCYTYRGSPEQYFQTILTNCFPEYSLTANYRIASAPAVPVTFLLTEGGIPRMAIVICGSNEYRTKRIQNTVQACQMLRIPVQRYYREFRNDATYVIQRVRSGLQNA